MKALIFVFAAILALSTQQSIKGKWMLCNDGAKCEQGSGPGWTYLQITDSTMQYFMQMTPDDDVSPLGGPFHYVLKDGTLVVSEGGSSAELGMAFVDERKMVWIYREKMDSIYFLKLDEPDPK